MRVRSRLVDAGLRALEHCDYRMRVLMDQEDWDDEIGEEDDLDYEDE